MCATILLGVHGVYANTLLLITHTAVFTITEFSVSVTCVSAHGIYVEKKTQGPELSCNTSCRSTDKPCDRVSTYSLRMR